MDFKTFFVKKVMLSYFISITWISVAMALIGMRFEPDARFGYEAFLSPLIFGAVATLPVLVQYSKNELSFRQTAIRKVLHFLMLEVIILSILSVLGLLTSGSMAISLAISIFVIDLTVNIVLWVNDQRTAHEFNHALVKLQREHSYEE